MRDELLEARPVRMPCDLHALPRRERPVQVAADGNNPLAQRCNLAVARVGARQDLERLDFLQQDGDGLLEVERLRRHWWLGYPFSVRHRSCTAPCPTICSTSATSVDEGLTRICADTSAFTQISLASPA